MARADPQINVRLKPDRRAILEAAVYVLEKNTPSALVRELVEEAIDRYADLPTVQKALEARAEQAAADEGKLSHLPGKSRGRSDRTSGKGRGSADAGC